jgi:integrase
MSERFNIRRQFKLALHILLVTLLKKSSLLLAGWEELDFDSGEWTIPKEHMKGAKSANTLCICPRRLSRCFAN